MGVFLFLVIAVIVIIVLVKNAKKARQKAAAEIVLKEKAERIVTALTEKGYELTYGEIESPYRGGHFEMGVKLYQKSKDIGELRFGTGGRSSDPAFYLGQYLSSIHSRDEHKINSFNHIIHLDKAGILFESKVPCSEPPPEWMKICAPLLISAGYTICYPEWMEKYECPDASKYVNVVFQ